jgi:hypothetical protein
MPFTLHLPTSTSWIIIIYVIDYLPLLLFCEHGKGWGFVFGSLHIFVMCSYVGIYNYQCHDIYKT